MTKKFNHKDFNLQDVILKRCQKESEQDWANRNEVVEIPKVHIPPKVKLSETVRYAMRQFKV